MVEWSKYAFFLSPLHHCITSREFSIELLFEVPFQMLSLLAVSLLILTANADVIDEDVNFSKVEDHFAVSNPAESKYFIITIIFARFSPYFFPLFENILSIIHVVLVESEMIMEDLFIKYPTLKPATDKEIIEVKKSFMEFLDMNHVKQREVS